MPGTAKTFLTSDQLLSHWQGHRRLTRRVIEAFPEDKFNTFSVGGMRPMGELAGELLRMAAPTVYGLAKNDWNTAVSRGQRDKAEVLRLWDESTATIDELWPNIPESRFREQVTIWGDMKDEAWWLMMYVVDNEIHHRAQGYVYLRALNIEPPHFWERD